MITTLKTMLRDEEGATMVEYGLLVALIALVAIVGVTALGHEPPQRCSTTPRAQFRACKRR